MNSANVEISAMIDTTCTLAISKIDDTAPPPYLVSHEGVNISNE